MHYSLEKNDADYAENKVEEFSLQNSKTVREFTLSNPNGNKSRSCIS